MNNNFKALFVDAMSKYVGVNITKNQANEIYTIIKKRSKDFDNISKIVVDNDNEINTHYFFFKEINGSVVKLYQSNSRKCNEDGQGDTLVIKGLTNIKVLEVGKKYKTPLHRALITILNLEGDADSINQRVTYRVGAGATIKGMKHSLFY